MGRRAVTSWAAGLLASGGLVLAGCTFDTQGVSQGGPEPDAAFLPPADGPSGQVDAPPGARPDAGPKPDAPPVPPDAPPPLAPGTLVSKPAPSGLLVDSYLDDWASAGWVYYTLPDSPHIDVYGTGYSVTGSARFASFYSGSSLYLAVRVEDDYLVTWDSYNLYDDDSVEIYLDLVGDASGPWGNDDHWIVFAASGQCSAYDGGSGTPALTCRGWAGADAFEIEARVDLAGLGAPTLGPGTTIGFGFGVNDDDGWPNPGTDLDSDQDAYVGWFESSRSPCSTCCSSYDHAEPWCDTTRLGFIQFAP